MNTRLTIIAVLLFMPVFLFACGGDSDEKRSDDDGDADTQERDEEGLADDGDWESLLPDGDEDVLDSDGDLDVEKEVEAEAEVEEEPPPEPFEVDDLMATKVIGNVTFEPDATDPTMQLHPAVIFDGEAVWMVYNKPDTRNTFDVYATRINGDGSTAVEPFLLNTTDFYELDPDLVKTSDGRIRAAWQTMNDEDAMGHNFDIYFRSFDVDGANLLAGERRLVMTLDGALADEKSTMVTLAALNSGRWAISGLWAHPDATAWQTFIQPMGADDQPEGEVIAAMTNLDEFHNTPALAAEADGRLHLVWLKEPLDADVRDVLWTSVAAGATTITPDPGARPFSDTQTEYGDVACSSGANGPCYVAAATVTGSDSDILVGRLPDPDSSGAASRIGRFGRAGVAEGEPELAVGQNEALVAWHQAVNGVRGALMVQGFEEVEGRLDSIGNPRKLNDLDTYMICPPTLTYIGEDIYFVAWVEGSNPDFRIKGRFIRARPTR